MLTVLDAKDAKETQQPSRAARLRDFLLSNWQLTTVLLSVLALASASLLYGASPLHYFKQLAIKDRELDAKQREFEYRQRMAQRYIELGTTLLDQGRFKDAGAAFADALTFDQYSVEGRLGKQKAELFAPSGEKQFDPAVIEQRIATIFADPGPSALRTRTPWRRSAT